MHIIGYHVHQILTGIEHAAENNVVKRRGLAVIPVAEGASPAGHVLVHGVHRPSQVQRRPGVQGAGLCTRRGIVAMDTTATTRPWARIGAGNHRGGSAVVSVGHAVNAGGDSA